MGALGFDGTLKLWQPWLSVQSPVVAPITISDSKLLLRIVPVLLVLFSVYFVISPKVGAFDSRERMTPAMYAATLGPIIGLYDGYFGPGTGSFFAVSCSRP